MLCSKSPFFQAALQGEFREGNEQTVELPETSASTFERFMLWIYTSRILNDEEKPATVDTLALLNLWTFGDFCGARRLQNDTMDCLIEGSRFNPKGPHPETIYASTQKGSPLRKLAVDFWTQDRGWQKIEKLGVEGVEHSIPYEALFDMSSALSKMKGRPGPFIQRADKITWANRCNYHIHEAGEPRCGTTAGGGEQAQKQGQVPPGRG